jgi:histone deacetylase 11
LKIVYHPRFLFGSRLLNWFHPFEFNRAQLAMERLQSDFGTKLDGRVLQPQGPVTFEDLTLVHDQSYLDSLDKNLTVTQVVEVPLLALAPRSWVVEWFITPTLWSVAGSLLAARTALNSKACLSLGGGFHHAKREGGEGFCLVSDIAYVIETLRRDGSLSPDDGILYVDLDVHQGNGISSDYEKDPSVKIMDAYNCAIYPVYGGQPQGRVDVPVPIHPGCRDEDYLRAVGHGLEKIKDVAVGCKLMIYNAGTDVFQEDKLGGLCLTHGGVNRRDLAVLDVARDLDLPLLILASGGYSKMSATLLGDLATAILES